jgi:ribonuclease I
MKNHKPGATVAVFITCGVAIFAALNSRRDEAPREVDPPPAATAKRAENRPGTAPARAEFDFYLLAMTLHAAWCDDGNGKRRECRTGSDIPLVVHGLWPERLAPRTYPRDCPGPRLALEPATEAALRPLMPGMQSGLHDHEWREHGTCSGLDDDEYFRATATLARGLDAALRDALTTNAGRELAPRELRAAADRARPGLGGHFTLHCRTLRDAPPGLRDRPFLVELRLCVDDDGANGAPGSALECASVRRRDQGCGDSFRIAGRAR